MLRKSSLFIVGMFMVFVVGLLNFNMAFAVSETYISDQDIIRQKVFYTGVITCYQTDEKEGGLIGSISVSDFYGDASSLIPYAATMSPAKDISYRNDGKSLLGCKQLLTKKTAKKLPTDVVASITEREERLKSAKYSSSSNAQVDNSEKKYCYSYAYKEEEEYENYIDPEMSTRDEKERFTPRLCLRREEGGDYVAFKEDIGGQSEDYIQFRKLGTSKLELRVKVDDNVGILDIFTNGSLIRSIFDSNYGYKFVVMEYDLDDWSIENESKFFAQVGNDIAKFMGSTSASSNLHNVESNETGKSTSVFYAACDKFEYYSDNSGIKCTTDDKYSARWDEQGKDSVIYTKMALGNLNDYRNYDNYNELVEYYSDGKFNYRTIKFEDDEIYRLYTFYLSNFYRVNSKNILCYDDTRNGAGDRRARLWWEEEGKYSEYCYFTVEDKYANEKVNGVDERKYFGKEIGLDELIATLNNLNLEDKPGKVSVAQNDNAGADACYDSAGVTGWLACPLITTSISLLDDVYDDVENNYLKIPAEDFFKKDNGGQSVYDTWDVFRNIANIAFIILLLVVIFSQLTGVGIDNYGVKKILPRIVIAAVLINLSYVVCELAVDISNVVGNSINNLFEGLTQNAGLGEMTGGYTANAAQYVVTFGPIGAISLAALFVSPGLIITVLLFLVSAVIAVLFLWVILITRQAGVVLAIVLSPLAFAFYILPNTNKAFKLWASVSKALLLLYPLCALAVGGGNVAGRVLASIPAENGSMRLAAMVVQVMPYFFIPALLKGSLSAMGNIGAKISGLGKGLNKATVGRFASSDTAKRARIALNNSDSTGFRTALANTKFGRFTGLSKVRARQIGAANKEKEERLEHGRLLQATISDKQEGMHPEEFTQKKFQERLNRAIQSNDEYQYFGLLDDSLRRFGLSKATKMHREAIENAGMNGLMSEGSRGKFLRNASERYEAFGTKDFGLGKYMQAGGRDRGQELISLDGFESDVLKVGDLKDAQAATLNAESIIRAMGTGLAPQSMAKRLMANKQARNQMDDTQLLIWAKYAEDGTILGKTEAELALRGRTGRVEITNDNGTRETINIRLEPGEATRLTRPLPEEVRIAG